jgi:hypothetical protein
LSRLKRGPKLTKAINSKAREMPSAALAPSSALCEAYARTQGMQVIEENAHPRTEYLPPRDLHRI